jgi:hypothetical protein
MEPERLALIDVADAGADALIEQQFAKSRAIRVTRSLHHTLELERLGEDIRSQVGDSLMGVNGQLHDGRIEADRDHVVERQDGRRTAFRLTPSLPWAIDVPRPGHPHVGMQGDATVELHDQVLAIRLDAFNAPACESIQA